MPRLNVIDPSTDTGPGAEILNGPLKAMQFNVFKGIANNAGVLKAFRGFAGGVKAGSLTEQEHETIALTTGQKNHCEYCLAAHTKIAQGTGLTEDNILTIRQGNGVDDKNQALIDFTLAILETQGFVTDEQLQQFKDAGFDDAAVIEVLGAIAVNTFTNLFNHVNETEIDFPVAATV